MQGCWLGCWGSAPHSPCWIFQTMTSETKGQGGWRGCWGSAPYSGSALHSRSYFSDAELDLSDNGIGADCAGMLAGVLGQCSSLAVLDRSDNDIGDEGAGRLATGLGQCSSLEKLYLACI